jgi:DtxR family Mn-dependent transcriptional regulator
MYLKSLYELTVDDQPVPISALAERLGHNVVSSTEMVHRLEGRGLVSHLPYQGVRLTGAGADHARALVRRHRVWERFLFDELGLGWEAVHRLACELEHVVGDEVTDRLDRRLGQPEVCPHGNPIPRGGNGQSDQAEGLHRLAVGQTAEVMAVHPETADSLAAASRAGLIPGARLRVESVDPESRAVLVRTLTSWASLPPDVAGRILVRRRAGGD